MFAFLKKRSVSGHVEEQHLVESIHSNWIDLKGRQMWIHGVETFEAEDEEPGVTYQMASKVIKNLNILYTLSPTKPVVIHMQTCGGDVVEGLAIYDAIKSMPYHKTIISYTHARSMSSYILQAADTRLLMPHSYFLFHDGEEYVGGTRKQVRSYLEFDDKHWEPILTDIYVKAMKGSERFKELPEAKLKKILRRRMDKKEDVYMPPKEAIDWGFADAIFSGFPK